MKTFHTFKLFLLCFVLLFCVSATGCKSYNGNIYDLYGTYDEEDQQLAAFISEIEPKFNGMYALEYSSARESCDNLVSIGIKGIPVLMMEEYRMEENILNQGYNNANSTRSLFYEECLYALLRVDRNAVRSLSFSEEGITRQNQVSFYRNAQSQIPKILREGSSANDKTEKLRNFGILAIPYVTEEIEKGNTEYEAYFAAIGLHMETPEFMTYMTDFSMSWEERFEKEGFMDGAEDFDYKVWLSENEEDLDNLFKFLDAYCAEYETVTTQ